MQINLLGYFHNDLNLKNIMVTKFRNNDVPVFIDYSFSKKVSETNLFPIECSIWISQIKRYFEGHKHIDKDNIKKFLSLADIFTDINIKYDIYDTIFIERFIAGSGVFTAEDYLSLPKIIQPDINKIFDSIRNFR
jgi:hypothetical protein